MKKVLVSGYYGFDNFGDELILTILVNKLKELGADVTVLSVDPEKTGTRLDVNSLNSFNMELIMERIPQFDILISGGGSLLQNATSNQSLFYYGGLLMTFNSLRKDSIIFAQGIGPIKGIFSKWISKYILKKCKYISVRDEKSQEFLKKWKISSELVCDPVFSLKLPPRKNSGKIGIQIRKYKTLTDKLFDEIIKEIGKRYSNKEIELISFQDLEDIEISVIFIKKLKAHFPDIKVSLVKGLSMEQIIERVATYDKFIGMRYHACALAIKYGISTMGIAYDPKVQILADSARIPCLKMDSNENNYEASFDALEALTSFNLLNWANSQTFDWDKTGLKEILNPEETSSEADEKANEDDFEFEDI